MDKIRGSMARKIKFKTDGVTLMSYETQSGWTLLARKNCPLLSPSLYLDFGFVPGQKSDTSSQHPPLRRGQYFS